MALFDDEILSVVLRFSNPNKHDMVDAGKIAANMSMSLDSVIRKSLGAGKALGDIFQGIKAILPTLKDFEKRAGEIGVSAGTVKAAQGILSRYTPQRLEKMAESASARIAETSGSAALRREIQKNTDILKRMVATQEGKYERATRGSNVGRGLFIDTETTGLNPLKHQVVELTATLFSFNKKTGEILNAQEQIYHGFQKLMFQSRHQFIPGGVSAQSLSQEAISTTRIRRLMQQADFISAHNAPFDKKFVERLVPQAASMPWLDTMRGIPWRTLGFRSRALQDLLRQHGIDPGQAHRATSDVAGSIKLLGTRPPIGGPTYMSMLLGNQGPLNSQQMILGEIKKMSQDIHASLQERLGEGRRFDPLSVRYTTAMQTAVYKASDGISERLSQTFIDSVTGGITARSRRPARSNDYGMKLGSGYSQEPTPGLLGESAITLDRRVGVVESFMRNLAVMSGPAMAEQMLRVVTEQQSFQEKNQQGRGRGRQIKQEIRPGEEVSLAMMSGVNTYLENERRGRPPGNNAFNTYAELYDKNRLNQISTMLSQPWAKPTREFNDEQISNFIGRFGKNPSSSRSVISAAAQMASSLNPNDPRYESLGSILLSGQKLGREKANRKLLEAQESAISGLAGGTKGKSKFTDAVGEALRGLDLGSERGSTTMFGDLADYIVRKLNLRRKSAAQTQRILSYDERARLPILEPDNLKGQMRFDSLQQKLSKLEASISATTTAFEHYRDVIAGTQKVQASLRYQDRETGIAFSKAGANLSFDAQLARLDARRGRTKTTARRRLTDIEDVFNDRTSSLNAQEIEAEARYESALKRQSVAMKRIATKEGYDSFQSLPLSRRTAYQDQISAITRPAEFNLQRAQLKRQLAGISDESQIEQIKKDFAARSAVTRFGSASGKISYLGQEKDLGVLRQEYSERVLESLGGSTLSQKRDRRVKRVVDDTTAANKQIEQQATLTDSRKYLSDLKYSRMREQNAAKLGTALNKIDATVDQKKQDSLKKMMGLEKAAHDARVKYLKREDLSGGGGGSTGGRSGSGGGGLFGSGGASRSGYGFGLGLAGLSAFDAGLKELIKDSAIYASRVQTMEFATEQMAKVNGLNVSSVLAEVDALKKRNLTTQEANSVVQKLMLTNQDLAKSTQLVEVAQNLAAISGADAMETVERLMSGIVTGYTRNLHMLGLQVTMVSAMRGLKVQRKAEGKTGEPTEIERREALVDQITQQGAKFTGVYEKSLLTAGGQFAYLKKEIQETSNILGREFLPAFGKAVLLITNGLHYIQENGDAFAHLTSAIASLGVAANALGSVAFIRWMIGSTGPMPWWLKLGALAAGALSFGFINQDKGELLAENKDAVIKQLKDKIATLSSDSQRTRDAMRTATGDDQASLQNSLKYQENSLRSAYQTIEDIEKQHTDNLANLYLERLDNQKKYFSQNQSAMDELVHPVIPFPTFSKAKGFHMGEVALFGEGFNSDTVRVPGKDAAEREKVKARAEQLKKEAQRVAALPPSLRNEQARQDAIMASGLADLQSKISTFDEKTFAGGAAALQRKFERGLQTPRERIEAERQISLYPIKNADKFVSFYKDMVSKSQDPEKAKAYQEQLDKALEVQSDAADLTKEVNKDAEAAHARLSRNTKAEIISIQAATKAEQLKGNVVSGNYVSEKKAIEETFQLNKKTTLDRFKLLGDTDQYKISQEQDNAEKVKQEIELNKRVLEGARKRREARILDESSLKQQDILGQSGLTSQEAINKALDQEILGLKQLSDDEERQNKIQQARIATREKLKDLAMEEAQAELERRVASGQRNVDVQSEVSRALRYNAPGRDDTAERIADIEQNRLAEIQKIEDERDRRIAFLDTDEGKRSLGGKPRASVQNELQQKAKFDIAGVNSEATKSFISTTSQEIETAKQRLAQSYQQRLSVEERLVHMHATSAADEEASIEQIHQLRLKYIQMEYEARGKTVEAERTKNEEMQQAEMDKLEQMVDLRKKQIEGIRSFAENLFETITTDHAQGLRTMLQGQIRGMGAKIFGNIATELFQNVRMNVPGIRDAKGNPTKLGRILAGTPFGTIVPTKEDIEVQAKKATDLNTEATDKNTQALSDLTDALEDLVYSAGTPVYGSLGGRSVGGTVRYPRVPKISLPSIGPWNNVPLFGTGGNNPLIFHMTSGTNATGGFTPGGGASFSPTISMTGSPTIMLGGGGSRSSPLISMGSSGGGASPVISLGGGGGSSPGISIGVGQAPRISMGSSITLGGRASQGESPTLLGDMSGGTAYGTSSAPANAATSAKALQVLLAHTNLRAAAPNTSASGLSTMEGVMGGGSGGAGGFGGMIMKGFPGQTPGSGGTAGGIGGSAINMQGLLGGGLIAGAGALQAFKSFGHNGGARGAIFGVGGGLQTAAGIAMMAGQPEIALPLMAAAMITDLIGGMFQDPRQKRAGQIQNYLGYMQYLAPPKLSRTTDLQGNLVSEGKGGLASDTGINAGNLKITSPYLLQENPKPSWTNMFSNPGAYLAGKPNVYQVTPNYSLSASDMSGTNNYSYTQVPGQILYNNLPADETPAIYNKQNVTVQISAFDSKSVLDRSSDIAAAVQKELTMGNGLSMSLQSAIFGVK